MNRLTKPTSRCRCSRWPETRAEGDSPVFAARKSGQSPRGATLIELLVVVGILALLAATAVPMLRPALEGRRVREAARAVNVYISSARNRALETGRPSGVMFQRMDVQAAASMIIQQVEVPPTYAGDSTNASAELQRSGNTVSATFSGGFNQNLVSAGDLIQFNNQGPWYTIDTVSATGVTAYVALRAGQILPWPTSGTSQPVSYRIIRQPTKSAATPLQLPMTTAVDLAYSGTDSVSFPYEDGSSTPITTPIYVLFSPNGSLEQVIYTDASGAVIDDPVVDPIYFLIGRFEKVRETTAGKRNFEDFNNLWVTLNPQTGMITTAPVAAPVGDADGLPDDAYDARVLARQAYSMGGQ